MNPSPFGSGADVALQQLVPVESVEVGKRLRSLDRAWVTTLAENIAEQGLHSPIDVVEVAGSYRLVFGAHRLAAFRHLGRPAIPAMVRSAESATKGLEERLREVSENLVRRELSVLDHAVHVASWREVYNAINPVKLGRKPKAEVEEEMSAKFVTHFSDAAQTAMGISRRAVFRLLQIASIEEACRDRIGSHPVADNQSELLLLSDQTPARQAKVVELLLGVAAPVPLTVSEALAIIDRLPVAKALAPHERVADAFSRLKADQQDQFFELHADAIERWLLSRKAGRH